MESTPAERARLPRPRRGPRRWTSFVAEPGDGTARVRALDEEANPGHRLRVEHDAHTLLIHLSGEAGEGWTTVAVDRATRRFAVGNERRQRDSAEAAYEALYEP